MKSTKTITTTTVLIFSLVTGLVHFANADLAAPTTGASSAPWPTEQQYCDSLCPSLSNSNGQVLGLNGSAGWTTADDQWCANHNAQTSPTVLPSAAPIGASLPPGNCTTAIMYPGDTSCAQTTAEVTHCQYHNSQVENYCMAYEGAKMAGGGEKTVLALDIAATGICAADCAAPTSFGGNIGMACEAGATVAGAAEIIVTLTQQSSTMGKIADLALGGAGVALGVRGLMNAGGVNACGASGGSGSAPAGAAPPPGVAPAGGVTAPQMNFDAPAGPQIGPIAPGVSDGMNERLESAECFLASLFIPNAEAAMNKCQKNACITAVAMAALTGVRYYNMGYGERTQKSSCGNVWALQSSNTTVGTGTSALIGGGVVGGSSGSGGGSINGSGTTNGTAGLNCMSSGGTVASCTGQQVSGATDGGLLNTGLGNAALPLAQQLQNQGLPAALSGSGGLGAAMGGAMGDSGDLGKALTKVAQEAAANGAQLASAAPYSGGGGGGGGGTASDATSPFAGLLGAGAAAPGASLQVFRGDGADTDIWHSHTDQNLFQIVSGRIGKVSPRVNNNF